ncbi:type IX secretion system anionic LPS delivery protein PorZ [Pelobium manganitolerans]|uniref:type IX secretion system anionic LPS delivery protein PorZ n=1 Tax=Pelobium manganitolerans TaxID=1842495 RepID=UPI003FA3B4FC
MRRLFLFVCFCFYGLTAFAQQVGLGQWRVHLPYQNALSLAVSADALLCATSGGPFKVEANELSRLSTIDGLASNRSKLVAFDVLSQQFMLVYEDANIDLIAGNKVFHLPEIYTKAELGNKKINAVLMHQGLAYLSCGFGIVVYDLRKREVKDTYYLGSNGATEVFELAIIDELIYANTNAGFLKANLSSNLADATVWQQINTPGSIVSMCAFKESLYALFSDGIYRLQQNTWQLSAIFSTNVFKLKADAERLLAIAPFRVISYNAQEEIIKRYNPANVSAINDALLNKQGEMIVADAAQGLLHISESAIINQYLPNGPNTEKVKELRFDNGKLVLAPGGITEIYAPAYFNDGFSVFEEGFWRSTSGKNNPSFSAIRDVVSSAYDKNTGTLYLASYVNGLLAINKDGQLRIYNQSNSTLQTTVGDASNIRVNGLDFDSQGNLWISQYGVSKPLSVKKTDGTWQAFDFSEILANPVALVTGLLLDAEDNKWLMLRDEGLLLFNGSLSKKIGFGQNGTLPGTNVKALALDKNGAVWIGTNKGVAVAYEPSQLFNGASLEIPNLLESGYLKPLLANQSVNCIAVDGANRKWMGTNNGVWLFNEDGTKQLQHFNKKNSPLLSDAVNSIAIDGNTGEVFFGTANGTISYRGDATDAVAKMEKVVVFPNPVRPGYKGNIGIKGLADGATVKITDITGTLVYETRAQGGQAVWNGKNFSNQEASSGVYLVLVINKDGSDTAVAKILMVR